MEIIERILELERKHNENKAKSGISKDVWEEQKRIVSLKVFAITMEMNKHSAALFTGITEGLTPTPTTEE